MPPKWGISQIIQTLIRLGRWKKNTVSFKECFFPRKGMKKKVQTHTLSVRRHIFTDPTMGSLVEKTAFWNKQCVTKSAVSRSSSLPQISAAWLRDKILNFKHAVSAHPVRAQNGDEAFWLQPCFSYFKHSSYGDDGKVTDWSSDKQKLNFQMHICKKKLFKNVFISLGLKTSFCPNNLHQWFLNHLGLWSHYDSETFFFWNSFFHHDL